MDKYNDIERMLKKLSDENPDKMDKIDEIDESVFARIEAKVLERLSKAKKARKARARLYIRAVAAAVGLITVFSIAFYLIDMPSTRATKDPQNATPTADGAQQTSIDENYGMPAYIPEGYVPDEGYESTGSYLAEYKYINPADDSLFILITIDGETVPFPDGGHMTGEREYNGLPLVYWTVPGIPEVNYANFTDAYGNGVQIAATLDYDAIMEIMASME